MRDDEFTAIFIEYRNAVYQFVWRMTNSRTTADDVTQDVFVAFLRGQISIDGSRGAVRSLLLGTARNLVWKQWRRDRRWSPLFEESFVAAPLPFHEDGREKAVTAAVSGLPPLQREALVLATYEELSIVEIAELLGVEAGTVKARLHRARENLKRMLSAYCPATGGSLER